MNTINTWAEDDRPREKLLLKGKHVLSDAELLAIILRSGSRELNAVELAKRILADNENSFDELSKRSAEELMNYPGMGETKSVTICAALELARRKRDKSRDKLSIRNSKDCFDLLRPHYEDLLHEEFHIILLNRANKVIGLKQISKGGISGTVADGKVIFKKALELQASAIILSHNHPSGQLKPSQADLQLTKKINEFGKMIDIQILDHLILTDNNYLSFADEGLM